MNIRFSNIVPSPLADQQLAGDVWAKNIEFQLGTNYHILATSGKGKSTFAHIFYGLRKDFSGTLFWGNQQHSVYSIDEIQILRSNTFGIVFQDLRLFLDQTPLENIAIHQSDLSSDLLSSAKINSFAQRLGIQDLMEKKCELLSYGQRQRVAILRALSRPFKWLILDEPFSHLDEENIMVAGQLILEIVKRNEASIVITGLNEIAGVIGVGKKMLI